MPRYQKTDDLAAMEAAERELKEFLTSTAYSPEEQAAYAGRKDERIAAAKRNDRYLREMRAAQPRDLMFA